MLKMFLPLLTMFSGPISATVERTLIVVVGGWMGWLTAKGVIDPAEAPGLTTYIVTGLLGLGSVLFGVAKTSPMVRATNLANQTGAPVAVDPELARNTPSGAVVPLTKTQENAAPLPGRSD